MRWPFLRGLDRDRARAALPPSLRERLRQLEQAEARAPRGRRLRSMPLALVRFVAFDLETTGPRLDRDRVISIGAVAVVARALVHADAYAAVLRQPAPSSVANILVHRIGGRQQLAGVEPAAALLGFLEYRGPAVPVAFRADFDATVLARELERQLGVRLPRRTVDLALLLPALFPATQNDTLEQWLGHFELAPLQRHDAVADAYATGQLLLIALDAAQRLGARTVGDLLEYQRAQRWLGRRR